MSRIEIIKQWRRYALAIQIKDWPGIAIRTGIYTSGDDFGEITGAAYLTLAHRSSCTVLDPTKPPPPVPSIVIDMVASDWDLGELARGDSEKMLAGAAQQRCFTYSGFESYRNFVVNSTNANGMYGNRYLLRNTGKPEQTVPYSVAPSSGAGTFPLPNIGGSAIRLNEGSRTCFVPTFKMSVGMSAGSGDNRSKITGERE
ncbi:hypothetical protein LGM42_10705 [Burkholderia sp. AU39826]|uniref:hypothetical protein n=1 Tax=Burkholderia sp. AU39826 TaxID=2879634 RepID=UPI001CF4CCFB|nr:hypothetical protein [Burkholderia sp. AU39826]MCA7970349.1 hypothetical protein [Burkholderia sp. AU39826]